MPWSPADAAWMEHALSLARRAEGTTNPNPMVGAVVVRNGVVVGEGFTQPYGGPHAEWRALEQAGEAARGATLYVSWEPCVAYPGKHNPPCCDRILKAGVARVVVAAQDPHPAVRGRGIARLAQAGVAVEVGLCQDEAQRLNEISHIYHLEGRPFVCLKWAMTLDGKIATRTGDSRWISGEASRTRTHALRRRHAAVLVGVDTVIADDPQLTVRHVVGRDPWRIVLDSGGRTPPGAKLLRQSSPAPTVIAATEALAAAAARQLERPGVRVWRLGTRAGRVDLPALLDRLRGEGLDSVLVEGGGRVHASFLEQGLVDKIVCFISPKIVGEHAAPGPVNGAGVDRIAQALQLEKLQVEVLDGDVLVTGYPRRAQPSL